MDFAQLLQSFGFPTAALVITVYAFVKELVVPGAAHRRQQVLLDRLLELNLRQSASAARLAEAAKKAVADESE